MKIKCEVCGNEFEPMIVNHYISRDEDFSGIAAVARKEEVKLYDTFDCPQCGCQVIAKERKRICRSEIVVMQGTATLTGNIGIDDDEEEE